MTRTARICAMAFAGIAGAILMASVAVAWMTARGAPAEIRLPFRLLCHGIESRAFEVFSAPMPICARCTGVYAGMLAGIVFAAVVFRGRHVRLPVSIAVVAAVPLAVDGIASTVGAWSTPNLPRSVTGFVAGAGFLVWVMSELRGWARAAEDRNRFSDDEGPKASLA